MGREQHIDVDKGAVHVLKPCLDVPVDLGANGRQRVFAAGRKGATAGFSIQEEEIPRETDCLLEGIGFEPSVPREPP